MVKCTPKVFCPTFGVHFTLTYYFLFILFELAFFIIIRNTCTYNYIFDFVNDQPIIHISLMVKIVCRFNLFYIGKFY